MRTSLELSLRLGIALAGGGLVSSVLAQEPGSVEPPVTPAPQAAEEAPAQEPAAPAKQEAPGGAAVTPAAATPAAATPAAAAPVLRVDLGARYVFRKSGSDSDQDLYSTVQARYGGDEDDVSGYLFGRLGADLDGHGAQRFAGLDDRLDDPYVRLYDAWAEFHRVPGLERVRVGRQRTDETPELVWFDGVSLQSKPVGEVKLRAGAYGGASTHIYESSASGDLTVGAFGQVEPWSRGRVRVDWTNLRDDPLTGRHVDDLLGLQWWQGIGARDNVYGRYTRIAGMDRDVELRLRHDDAELAWTTQLSYFELLHTQRQLVLEADPFFNALHELFPYRQFGARTTKGFGDHVDATLGYDLRTVVDGADVATFNRDYQRYQVVLGLRDLPAKDWSLDVDFDAWQSDAQIVRTWGADLEYRKDDLRLGAGTYYSLYKYDLFLDDERDHVRTWFVRVRWHESAALDVELAGEYESSDLADFYLLRLGATWHF